MSRGSRRRELWEARKLRSTAIRGLLAEHIFHRDGKLPTRGTDKKTTSSLRSFSRTQLTAVGCPGAPKKPSCKPLSISDRGIVAVDFPTVFLRPPISAFTMTLTARSFRSATVRRGHTCICTRLDERPQASGLSPAVWHRL